MRLFIVVLGIMFSLSGLASGVITLSGTIKSFDSKTLVILSKNNLYYVDRTKIGELNRQKTKTLKYKQKISLTVPFESVLKAKHGPQKIKK